MKTIDAVNVEQHIVSPPRMTLLSRNFHGYRVSFVCFG
jgi:hypothetical protein